MKKIYLFILIFILTFNFGFSSIFTSSSKEDYKVIKRAIEEEKIKNEEVKWFKILIIDNKTKRPKVRITIPFPLMELIINSCPQIKFNIERGCKIELKKILKELKKLGPMYLIEVYDEEEIVKIWLE